jgi:hypothetical protein
MRTIYFHCGAPKTGTSYLQTLFAQFAKELRAHDIIYPFNEFVHGAEHGKITSGNGVPMANYIRPNLPHHIANKEGYLEEFKKQLNDAEDRDLLFSSEFLKFPDNEKTKNIINLISEEGYQPKVIYLVRDFGDAAFSTYSQEIKRAGEFRSFSKFIRSWDPLYVNDIRNLKRAFGEKFVFVYNYDEHMHDLQYLLFKTFLGTEIEIENKQKINRSLNQDEIKMMRFFNEITGGNANLSNFANDALMSIPALSENNYKLEHIEYELLSQKFSQAVDEINTYITGRKIKLGTILNDPSPSSKISESERFVLAILAKLVGEVKR